MKTIVAISTALQNAAIGVIRLSGDDAISIAESVFTGKMVNRKAVLGRITDSQGNTLDHALATAFFAPNSYTGENVVEFSCHGGIIVLQQVLERLVFAGATPAQRGEFTKRAFLNGKMDLSQSEAIIDIITAKSPLSAKEAFLQADGSLRNRINSLRSTLLDIDSEIMVYADFAAEGIDPPDSASIVYKLTAVLDKVLRLCNSYTTGKIIKEGYPVAVCGKPNVGKSSLMNCLLGSERSIVTEIAGTTRDVVSENALIDGLCVLLSDTAGIHESDDTVEKIGIERAVSSINASDMVLCVFDGSKPLDKDDMRLCELIKGKNALAVINKCDLPVVAHLPDIFETVIKISAKTAEGIDMLCKAIKDKALSDAPIEQGEMITNLRHKKALDEAYQALSAARDAIKSGIDPEIAEIDIRNALDLLGLITGDSVTEDLIDRIYENFCVGK